MTDADLQEFMYLRAERFEESLSDEQMVEYRAWQAEAMEKWRAKYRRRRNSWLFWLLGPGSAPPLPWEWPGATR